MCSFGASCYSARLSWALVLTWVNPFIQDKTVEVWDGRSRLSRYDIRAEGALPPSITVIARVKKLGYWICNVSLRRINFKIEMCALWICFKRDCSAKGTAYLILGLVVESIIVLALKSAVWQLNNMTNDPNKIRPPQKKTHPKTPQHNI